MPADYTPRPEAWEYFLKNQANIRSCIEAFGAHTWSPHDRCEHTPTQLSVWDKAVQDKNVSGLWTMMSDAWYKAPDSSDVYSFPGFSAMCNLLDETVPGFMGDHPEEGEGDDNEPAF